MRIIYRTNLDEPQRDVYALNDKWHTTDNHPVPRVGEYIEIGFAGPNGERFAYNLRVVQVSYVDDIERIGGSMSKSHVSVELHMPANGQSIKEWSDNFKRHRYGRTV